MGPDSHQRTCDNRTMSDWRLPRDADPGNGGLPPILRTGGAPRLGRSRRFTRISSAAHGLMRTRQPDLRHTAGMNATVMNPVKVVTRVVLGVGAARSRLPGWAAGTALAVGVAVAAITAFLTHGVVMGAPLFARPQEVPSVTDPAPAPQYAPAVE